MKRCLFLLIIAGCFCNLSHGQFSIRLVVTDVATKKLDDIYVMGSFNDWKPGETTYKLKPFGGSRKAIVLSNMPAGKYEFKFTRGNMDNVETNAKGEDITNRIVEVTGDVSVNCSVAGWKDDYPDKPIPNTASPQVHIIDTAFYIPQLGRSRRIWAYIPASYNTMQGKHYPVLYMQDGQNLFNLQTASNGEWGVDEILDSLQKTAGLECIVIGIDHGGDKRMTEYNPYDNDKYGKGEGKLYAEFLAKTLKPYIDTKYRTIKDAAHTYVAGSSMGGLISLYALIQYPDIFGAAGIFSPSFAIAPGIYQDVKNANWATMPRFYFYAGRKEGGTMEQDMVKMVDLIKNKNNGYDIRSLIYPPGQHNEEYWRMELPGFFLWLLR